MEFSSLRSGRIEPLPSGLKARAKCLIPNKPLIEGDVILHKHRPHLRLKIALFVMRILRIDVPNQHKPVAQANGEHRIATLPTEPGKLRSFLLNPFRRRDLQSLNHSRDRFSPGKEQRDVHVIGNAANSHTNIFRTVQNGGKITMDLTPNSILQKRTPIFSTEHLVYENLREGLSHAGEYNASLQPGTLHTAAVLENDMPVPQAKTSLRPNRDTMPIPSIQSAALTLSGLKARAKCLMGSLCTAAALLLICAIPSHAQPPHTLRIRIINAQTNQPIPDERLNVALRVDQIGSVAIATDKNGIILVDTGRASIIRILANMYADCRPRAELYTNYSVATIHQAGITTGNLCSSAHRKAQPGELVLYEIPKTYIPTFGNPPASGIPHSDENPHAPRPQQP